MRATELIKRWDLVDLVYIGSKGSMWRYAGRKKDGTLIILTAYGWVAHTFNDVQTERLKELLNK
jgi:hypothetical protein